MQGDNGQRDAADTRLGSSRRARVSIVAVRSSRCCGLARQGRGDSLVGVRAAPATLPARPRPRIPQRVPQFCGPSKCSVGNLPVAVATGISGPAPELPCGLQQAAATPGLIGHLCGHFWVGQPTAGELLPAGRAAVPPTVQSSPRVGLPLDRDDGYDVAPASKHDRASDERLDMSHILRTKWAPIRQGFSTKPAQIPHGISMTSGRERPPP